MRTQHTYSVFRTSHCSKFDLGNQAKEARSLDSALATGHCGGVLGHCCHVEKGILQFIVQHRLQRIGLVRLECQERSEVT